MFTTLFKSFQNTHWKLLSNLLQKIEKKKVYFREKEKRKVDLIRANRRESYRFFAFSPDFQVHLPDANISEFFTWKSLFFSSKKYRNVRLQFCSQIIQVYFLKRLSTYFVIRTHKTSQKAPFNRIYRFNTNHNYTEESEKNKVPKSDQRVCKKWHRDKQIT